MSRLSDNLIALIRNPETPDYVIRDAIQEEELAVATIYVVQGSTGEYSDRSDWLVAAFLTKEDADNYCELCSNWCKENNMHFSTPRDMLADYNIRHEARSPYDPNFHCDYTGTGYEVFNLPLKAGVANE